MKMNHGSKTLDDTPDHRPRSNAHHLALTVSFLILTLAACNPKESTVTLALLGDLMIGRGVDPTIDSLAYLMPDLSAADLALANLESPLSSVLPTSESPYNLCALSVRAQILPAWGLDLLSLANNHRLDCGPGGPALTRSILKSNGITSIGPDMKPIYREVNGLHLAFLAFDENSILMNENAALKAISSARLTGSLVVVSIHWGAEYQGGASEKQRSLAKDFAQAGAALIWGHHPHVLQPAEWISPLTGSKNAGGSTLVLYSLGNALFDQAGLEDTRWSALAVVTLNADGVTAIRIQPFEIDVINSRIIQPDSSTAAKIHSRLNLP